MKVETPVPPLFLPGREASKEFKEDAVYYIISSRCSHITGRTCHNQGEIMLVLKAVHAQLMFIASNMHSHVCGRTYISSFQSAAVISLVRFTLKVEKRTA